MVGGVRRRNDARYEGRTDTELVQAARGDEPEAFGELFQRWFDRSWNVARAIIREDDLAAEIAQDAMLKAWQGLDQLQNPDAFGGWLLRITRNRALSRLEREQRSRATEDNVVSGLQDRQRQQGHDSLLGGQAGPDVDVVVDVRDRQELVWAAAQALGERDASLLDLHLRHGLSPAEIADEMGVEANAAHQQLFRLRGKLGEAIGSYLLWRNGRPLCQGLAAAVSGRKAFDRSVSRAVTKHQVRCQECSERRAGLVDPAKLFASVPLLVVPAQFKTTAAAALAEAGVPMGDLGGLSGGGRSFDDADGSGDPSGGPGPSDGGAVPSGSPSASPPTGSPPLSSSSGLSSGSPPPASPVGVPPVGRGLAWTVTKRAWGRSLLAVGGVVVAFLAVVGLADSMALSDLLPFGGTGDDQSIGSEVLSGPIMDEGESEAAPTGQSEGDNRSTGGDGSGEGEAGDGAALETSGSTDSPTTANSSSSTTESGDTTVTTADSTTSSSETTRTTVSTTVTTSSSTSETRPTTETTVDTSSSSSSSSTETTATTDTTAFAPPVILRFTSRTAQVRCNDRTQRPYEAIWVTENTTSVELFLPDGSSRVGKPEGSALFCAVPQSRINLLASGPGGQAKASTTLP